MRFSLLGLIIIPVGIVLYKLYEYNREQRNREGNIREVKRESQFTGQNQTICVICLKEFDTFRVTKLPCMHKFHTECITKVFTYEVNWSCPHCRKPVPHTFKA